MFKSYHEARRAAEKGADSDGFDRGIERVAWPVDYGWRVFMLPQKKNRCGHELRCEVVSATLLERCQKGHGP